MGELALLAFVGLFAGAMNAVAGGGTFVSLPALIAVGVPSVAANMTSTVALFPGALASAYAFRREFRPFGNVSLPVLLGVSLIGGVAGALLLINTSSRFFDVVVPWLLLFGSIAFAFGRQIGDWLRPRLTLGKMSLLTVQFVLGLYGGYFGGAVGLMMLAAWTIFGVRDLMAMSAARTLIVGATNAVAVIFFVAIGTIYWAPAMMMLIMAIVGGYVAARIVRLAPLQQLRLGIATLNFTVTAAFFWRTFF
jgi:uncharacterized membrane protein YfcA